MKFLGFLASATAVLAASLQQVRDFGKNPTNLQMYIYVPDKLAASPPVIVAVSQQGKTRASSPTLVENCG
jgi:poly(3-hydroxybutyrate) depolymerase